MTPLSPPVHPATAPSGRYSRRCRGGRGGLRRAAGLVLVLLLGGVLLAACTKKSPGHPSTAPKAQPQFAANRDSINGYTDLKGNKFVIRGDPGRTGLVLRDGRIVRGTPSNSGPTGAPIAVVANKTKPNTVSMSFVFTAGSTQGQNAVLGTCAVSFAKSSIQLATFPDQWKLFYTEKRTGQAGTDIVTIAQGTLGPLKTDGSTVYTESMKVDLAGSSVTIQVPGTTRTVTDPHIAKFWGAYTALPDPASQPERRGRPDHRGLQHLTSDSPLARVMSGPWK